MKRAEAIKAIREFYAEGGRVRKQIPARILKEYSEQRYKKGYEIRIVVKEADLDRLMRSLSACNIKAGSPYDHSRKKVVPIYGKNQVEWFTEEIIPAKRRR